MIFIVDYRSSICMRNVSTRLVNLAARQSARPVYYYEFGHVGNSSHYVDPDTKRPIGNYALLH